MLELTPEGALVAAHNLLKGLSSLSGIAPVDGGCEVWLGSTGGTIARCSGLFGDPGEADFNGDGIVNSTDVIDFINAWFVDQVEGTLVTDWDGNGIVNSTDVGAFINDWFEDTGSVCG